MTWYTLYKKFRERWVNLHTALVARDIGSYGGNCRIEYPFEVLNPERFFLGKNTVIARGGFFSCVTEYAGKQYDGRISIGDNCQIRDYVQISAAKEVRIGHGVGISRCCLLCDHHHDYTDIHVSFLTQPLTDPQPIILEDNCGIGGCSMIGPGVRVGKGSIVGFGSIVLKDVPPYSMVIGRPAVVIKQYDAALNKWINVDRQSCPE